MTVPLIAAFVVCWIFGVQVGMVLAAWLLRDR